jgi:hypothetical protein
MMTSRLAPIVGLALAAVALAASPETLAVRDARAVISGDMVAARVQLDGLFSTHVRQSLDRALPASLVVTVDLWRDRAGWFDQLVESRSALFRVRYDAWGEDFDVGRDVEPATHVGDLDEVADSLERPMLLPIGPRSRLTPGHRYYLVVTASLRPLTPEGLREIEEFLGRQSPRRTSRPGSMPASSLARLPRSLLSVIAALSGLGDEIAVRRTARFAI